MCLAHTQRIPQTLWQAHFEAIGPFCAGAHPRRISPCYLILEIRIFLGGDRIHAQRGQYTYPKRNKNPFWRDMSPESGSCPRCAWLIFGAYPRHPSLWPLKEAGIILPKVRSIQNVAGAQDEPSAYLAHTPNIAAGSFRSHWASMCQRIPGAYPENSYPVCAGAYLRRNTPMLDALQNSIWRE